MKKLFNSKLQKQIYYGKVTKKVTLLKHILR